MAVGSIPPAVVDDAVRRALAEDLIPLGDITSGLMDPAVEAQATFVSRAVGVVAGCACAQRAFELVDPSVVVQWSLGDGDEVAAGSPIATVSGPLPSILTAERTALNFLSHLSGVASLTRRFVDAAANGGTSRIWDTRKTTPGLRTLEKAAVRAGGGVNHRGNLSEWVMIKDNHLAGAPMADLVDRARRAWPGRTIEVECDTAVQVEQALDAGVDLILLDNMTPDQVASCVAMVRDRRGPAGRPLVEASGGVTLATVADYAAAGVDCISIGALTNAAGVLDIGLDLSGPALAASDPA
jgi:nicotinate-nucleotide pyrophosphorylase (carboxylating)